MSSKTEKVHTTAFLGVFEEKLEKLIKRIKHERDKKARGEHTDLAKLKATVKEAKKLKNHVKEMQEASGKHQEITCPHCKKKFKHTL